MLLDAFPVGPKSVTLASIWTQSDIAASSCHLVQKAILLFLAKARGVMATLSLGSRGSVQPTGFSPRDSCSQFGLQFSRNASYELEQNSPQWHFP